MSSERPAKRVRQACEPCRRKKSRCPGEKPVCSHCSRLRQNCYYAEERHESERPLRSVSPPSQPQPTIASTNDRRLEDRLKFLETQLAEVLANQESVSRNGNTRRASIHSSLAMSLAHNAGLMSEIPATTNPQVKEERRRCFWSLFLLKRLHGADFMVLDFSTEDNFPWYPESTNDPITPNQSRDGSMETSECSTERGIIAYAIQLSEVWFKITRYAWRRGKPSNLPPWSLQSEYSTIMAQQMDFETRMPYAYRFKPAKFSQRPLEELNASRNYWGPWLLVQFLYHTNLCLLNHPLLLSLRLRNFKCVIPEIFLQHTADLIASHASWIINFIDMLEAKQFKVTDPFLGHCVAIIATIYLQESFVDDPSTRREKHDNFDKCLQFIRGFSTQWPHVGRIAEKLEGLSVTVSSTHVASDEPTRQNRKLLIDLGQFFEVLEYASSSEVAGSARNLFGPSLRPSFPRGCSGRMEMAQTSVLPEPTRVERQEFGSATATPVMMGQESVGGGANDGNGFVGIGGGGGAGNGSVNNTPLQFSNDELAVLAENFFHQRPEFDGSGNWWNMGNL
ncbi:hypothetical protein G7Y89_g13422 [Cudoniella acicularis]|uniref:Zn(2)-C6 fungal-type domain-containing protein n=1 Tax=Cudoniella acicularis TaxID=354080 RepID=A0A8H4R9M9_9HELO|nr:hypothetical protein G7Y89_g13422 [Cudoniella acicularis]